MNVELLFNSLRRKYEIFFFVQKQLVSPLYKIILNGQKKNNMQIKNKLLYLSEELHLECHGVLSLIRCFLYYTSIINQCFSIVLLHCLCERCIVFRQGKKHNLRNTHESYQNYYLKSISKSYLPVYKLMLILSFKIIKIFFLDFPVPMSKNKKFIIGILMEIKHYR